MEPMTMAEATASLMLIHFSYPSVVMLIERLYPQLAPFKPLYQYKAGDCHNMADVVIIIVKSEVVPVLALLPLLRLALLYLLLQDVRQQARVPSRVLLLALVYHLVPQD